MSNILLITSKVDPNSPQGIRYRNFLKYLSLKNNITILSLSDYVENQEINIKKIIIKPKIYIYDTFQKENSIKSFKLNLFFKSIFKKFIKPIIFPDKYIFFIGMYKRKIREIIKIEKINVIIIGFTPFSLYLLTKYIKKINKNIKVIIDFSDPFFMNGDLRLLSFYKKFCIYYFEKYYLQYCDKIVVLNPMIKNLYSQYYNQSIKKENIFVIEQGFSDDFLKLHKPIKRNNTLNLIYAGSLYFKLREPFELYEAVKEFGIDIKLTIFGNINKALLPDLNDHRFEFHEKIHQEDLINIIQRFDLVIFIDNFYGYQVPGKLLELIALKIPVLFIYKNDNSPTFHYIKDYKGFIKVKNDKNQILKALKDFSQEKITLSYESNLINLTWENLAYNYNIIINL